MATFKQVYNYLLLNGSVRLPYATNKNIIFTAIADVCQKGQRAGQQIIRITSGSQTNILIYKEDWGQIYTISGTLIAHVYDSLNPFIENILIERRSSQQNTKTQTKVGISSIVFTHRILWSTVKVLRESARKAENDSIRFYLNLSVMVHLYFSLEAYLNYLGENINPQLWKNEKDFFRRRPYIETMGKLDYLMEKCNMNIDKSCRPYQTIKKLHKIRVYLVHGKTDRNRTTINPKHLKKRSDNKQSDAFKSFLDINITEGNTEKAMIDTERIITDLHSAALNNYPHEGLFQDPLMGILIYHSSDNIFNT